MNWFRTQILIGCILVVLSSCKKETDTPSWNTGILVPVLKTSLTINNLITDSLLKINPDSSLMIAYNSELYSFSVDKMLTLPDTSVNYSWNSPINFLFLPGDPVIDKTSEIDYDLDEVQLVTALLKSEQISFYVRNKIKEIIDFTYAIPSATLNGIPFQVTASIPAATNNGPGIYNAIFDLAGYKIDLTGTTHNKTNTVISHIKAMISPNGQNVTVTPNDSLIIVNSALNVVPYYAKGYFGENKFTFGPEETSFSLFKKITSGTINLKDVNLNLKIENYIGTDARVIIDSLTAINSVTNSTIKLNSSSIGSAVNINRASDNSTGDIYSSSSVNAQSQNFVFNSANSNIKNLIENLPGKIGYSLQVITNPLGNVSGNNDFIYSDKGIKTSMELEIPLSLVANDLTLSDTAIVDLGDMKHKNNIKNLTLILMAENGFPFDASIQAYILDQNDYRIDSLFTQTNFIEAAPVDADIKVTGPKLSRLNIPLNSEKRDKVLQSKKMLINAKFNTSAKPQFVKIYSNYQLDFKLVADFDYTIDLK